MVITWNTPTDEPTDYRVSWAPADEEYLPFTEENTPRRGNSYPAGDVTTLTLTGLAEGVSYKMIMRARYHDNQNNEDTSGPWTAEATQAIQAIQAAQPVSSNPPAAPTGLRTLATDEEVILEWDDPADESITGYEIWRGLEASSLQVLAVDTGSAGNSYLDNTVTPETTYHYAINAINADGTSEQSDTISATTQASPELLVREDEAISARQSTATAVAVSNLGNYAGDQTAISGDGSPKRPPSPRAETPQDTDSRRHA